VRADQGPHVSGQRPRRLLVPDGPLPRKPSLSCRSAGKLASAAAFLGGRAIPRHSRHDRLDASGTTRRRPATTWIHAGTQALVAAFVSTALAATLGLAPAGATSPTPVGGTEPAGVAAGQVTSVLSVRPGNRPGPWVAADRPAAAAAAVPSSDRANVLTLAVPPAYLHVGQPAAMSDVDATEHREIIHQTTPINRDRAPPAS
jgi:hypothetical protein